MSVPRREPRRERTPRYGHRYGVAATCVETEPCCCACEVGAEYAISTTATTSVSTPVAPVSHILFIGNPHPRSLAPPGATPDNLPVLLTVRAGPENFDGGNPRFDPEVLPPSRTRAQGLRLAWWRADGGLCRHVIAPRWLQFREATAAAPASLPQPRCQPSPRARRRGGGVVRATGKHRPYRTQPPPGRFHRFMTNFG